MTDNTEARVEWVLVPKEPTEAMNLAGLQVEDADLGGHAYIDDVYAAMLASAPPAPSDAVAVKARRAVAMICMEISEDRSAENVAHMFKVYEHDEHDCPEKAKALVPYANGCGRCDVDRAYADADRIRSVLVPAPSDARRVRHLKRGTIYELIGEAEAQITKDADGKRFHLGRVRQRWLTEGDKLAIYRCEQTGKMWARFLNEFNDGRFVEIIPAAPAPPDALKVAVEALGAALEPDGYVLRWDDGELFADRYAGGHWQHLSVSKLALATIRAQEG